MNWEPQLHIINRYIASNRFDSRLCSFQKISPQIKDSMSMHSQLSRDMLRPLKTVMPVNHWKYNNVSRFKIIVFQWLSLRYSDGLYPDFSLIGVYFSKRADEYTRTASRKTLFDRLKPILFNLMKNMAIPSNGIAMQIFVRM